MSSYLMTHSLLASWLYIMKDNPYEDATSTRDSYQEFLQTLRREPIPPNEAMQKGIEFEDLCYAIANGTFRPVWEPALDKKGLPVIEPNSGEPMGITKYPRFYDAAKDVADIIRGGQIQYRAKKIVEVNGMQFVLYGRLDTLKAGTIYDIKFFGSYDKGKFVDSTQHPTYMQLIPEADRFTYIVSNGQYVWTETYFREETPDIFPVISDFVDWLNAVGLMETYKEYWKSL